MSSVYDVVQQLCLSFPETEETIAYGFPNFKVRDKTFATFSVNHHGDNKVALLLNISLAAQQMLVTSAPKYFYVPPYSGPKGWVGVELNQGLAWDRVSQLTTETYQRLAPANLARAIMPPNIKPPTQEMRAEDINPLLSRQNRAIIQQLRAICLALPEVTQTTQFGAPAFKAGKKSFCILHHHHNKTMLQIWVGIDQQASLTAFDARYRVPAYVGHRGWIDLGLSQHQNWPEIAALIHTSYEHFALKRMLKALADTFVCYTSVNTIKHTH